jgi:hypothetical protein
MLQQAARILQMTEGTVRRMGKPAKISASKVLCDIPYRTVASSMADDAENVKE